MILVTAREMQEMDRLTIESFGLPGRLLMEVAGRGATRFFMETFPDFRHRRIGVIAGRGNNGGDGFVMARYLSEAGADVTVFLLSTTEKVVGDALSNLDLLKSLDIPVVEMPDRESFDRNRSSLRHQGLLIDAILGTGLNADVKSYFGEVISFLNDTGRPIFSVDIPSGLNSDTGQVCGNAIRAAATATFGCPKIAHYSHPGAVLTGRLKTIDIGIPSIIEKQVGPKQYLVTPGNALQGVPPRKSDAHKGQTGHLLVLGGSPGKTGAIIMSAEAALRSGAGLVTVGVPEALHPTVEMQTLEAMTAPIPDGARGIMGEEGLETVLDLLSDKKCIAVGPGLGTSEDARTLLFDLLPRIEIPMVLDADALSCLAFQPEILKRLRAPAILTPHPGEMARLTGTDSASIQKNRLTIARNFAGVYGCHVLLKGAGTLIAHPDGTVYLNPTGNPGMATGGMGDVLTGLIAGLMAQGAEPAAAGRAGAFIHGAAADALASRMPVGFLAGEVSRGIPMEIHKLSAGPAGTSARGGAL